MPTSFKYDYVEDLLHKKEKYKDAPLQVELQPGTHCFGLDCKFCYGKGYQLYNNPLSIEEYATLISDLCQRIDFIELSGIRSDPLSYPEIEKLISLILKSGMTVGIHTKGVGLSDQLIDILSQARNESFITFSVDAPDAKVYQELHGADHFEKVCQQIEKLYHSSKRKIHINVAYLLFENNSSPQQLEHFLKRFSTISDRCKFSIPQVPHRGTNDNYLTPDRANNVIHFLKELNSPASIVLENTDSTRDYHFTHCHSQRYNLTIDNSGNIFPCPQISLKKFAHLIFGNIRQNSIWEIWQKSRKNENKVSKLGCQLCGRRDEAINHYFANNPPKSRKG